LVRPWDYIKSDAVRYMGNASGKSIVNGLFRNRSFKYMFWFRLGTSGNFLVRNIAKFMHHHLSNKYHIQNPIGTQIGYGFYIGHHMCVVINKTTKIGNNCNVSQFLSIGSNRQSAAEIGDNVYIGPNVCIVENVKIGSFSTIGAGSVVTKSVHEGHTVAGVPARTISTKNPRYSVTRQYLIED